MDESMFNPSDPSAQSILEQAMEIRAFVMQISAWIQINHLSFDEGIVGNVPAEEMVESFKKEFAVAYDMLPKPIKEMGAVHAVNSIITEQQVREFREDLERLPETE